MPNIYKVFLKEVNRVDGKDVDINTFVGEKGEIFFDIDKNRLKVSDGSTPGGVELESNSPTDINTTGTSHFTNTTVAGIATFSDIIVRNINATGITTYEDVRNVDSIGIVTARQGLEVTGGDLNVGNNIKLGNASGIVTATSFSGPATRVTVTDQSADTSCNVLYTQAPTGNQLPHTGSNLTFNSSTGALSATSFEGSGANLTGISAGGLTSAAGSSRNFWHSQTSSSWSTNSSSFVDSNIALDCGTMTSDGFILVVFTEGRREENWNQTGGAHLHTINNGSSWEYFGFTDGNYNKHGNLPNSNEYRVYQGTYCLTVATGNHVKFKIQGRKYGGSNQYFLNNQAGQYSGIYAIKIAS